MVLNELILDLMFPSAVTILLLLSKFCFRSNVSIDPGRQENIDKKHTVTTFSLSITFLVKRLSFPQPFKNQNILSGYREENMFF